MTPAETEARLVELCASFGVPYRRYPHPDAAQRASLRLARARRATWGSRVFDRLTRPPRCRCCGHRPCYLTRREQDLREERP